jgi:hypothetical protein
MANKLSLSLSLSLIWKEREVGLLKNLDAALFCFAFSADVIQ